MAWVIDGVACYTKDFLRPRRPWWGLFGDENHVGFYVGFLYRLLDFRRYVLYVATGSILPPATILATSCCFCCHWLGPIVAIYHWFIVNLNPFVILLYAGAAASVSDSWLMHLAFLFCHMHCAMLFSLILIISGWLLFFLLQTSGYCSLCVALCCAAVLPKPLTLLCFSFVSPFMPCSSGPCHSSALHSLSPLSLLLPLLPSPPPPADLLSPPPLIVHLLVVALTTCPLTKNSYCYYSYHNCCTMLLSIIPKSQVVTKLL